MLAFHRTPCLDTRNSGWGGDGCPTFDGYAQALLTPGSPYVEAVCGCVDGSGARYDVIVGYTGYGGDELTFDAGGILRWVKTVSGANADMPTYCCKPEGHRATWLSYGTPVPGLDCTAAVEDTSVGPYDAICDGL